MKNLKSSAENIKAFPERLRRTIGSKSARSFARACGISQTAIAQYLSGKSEPTRLVLIAIAEVGNVNLEWLMCGTGPMYRSNVPYLDGNSVTGPSNQWPPLIPILMKSKIIGTMLANETEGRNPPLKELADKIVHIYLDDYVNYTNGDKKLPTAEASTEVIESLRPHKPVGAG